MDSNKRHRFTAITMFLAFANVMHAQAENMDSIADAHHLAAYFVAALMITVFVMIFSNRLYYFREQEVSTQAKQLNTQLSLVLNSNKKGVWTYDTAKNVFSMLTDSCRKQTEYTSPEFAKFYGTGDYNILRTLIAQICEGEKDGDTVILHARPEIGSSEEHIFQTTLSVLQRDKKQRPRILIGIERDITDETLKQKEARRISLRYHTVFHASLVDMIYYNADGVLTDINDKACETFGISDREAILKRGVRVSDIPPYREIDIDRLDTSVEMSVIADIDQIKRHDERIPEVRLSGKFYYETTLTPVRNKEGKLRGVVAAGRNITEMVESHHRQQKDSLQLQQTTMDMQTYIDNINYTLRTSGVRLINYYPSTHELHIFSDLNQIQYRLSQIRCASLIHQSDRRKLRGLFLRMDHCHMGAFNDSLHTIFHDQKGRDIYLSFNIFPVTGRDGAITHYFGLFRNDTEMVYTEMQLREETQKAQETEELKNTFLLNMSYEIRTPLNAVIGFAELFNAPHEEEDEPVFAEEIKRNTGELLALINDILFISRLDAHMVEFNYHECDFALLFDGFCYMGWSDLSPGVKVTVENPYNRLIVKIDEQNLGDIIQKLCSHASRMTTEGTIRAKYEYRHGELSISIADTGRGLSKKSLPHVFDRFARDENNKRNGTGLDMPIIREQVQQMGGSIEIQSEEGKGSTVYLIIPCEMSSLEKKTEIII